MRAKPFQACLTALFLTWTLCACAPTSDTPTETTIQSADGTPIAYDVHGDGDVALVFVHGWSCDRTYWRHQVDAFASDFRVVTVDLAAHGESGQERVAYTIPAFGEDVIAVVNALDARKVILIGHSMGGAVIAETAKVLQDRVIGLIGVDTLQDVSNTITPDTVASSAAPFETDFEGTMRNFTKAFFAPSTPEALATWIEDDMASAPPAPAISALKEYLGLYTSDAGSRVFETIDAPIHCLNAPKWPTATASNRKLMGSFDVTIMQDVGHFPMLEKPQEFNVQLRKIVDSMAR